VDGATEVSRPADGDTHPATNLALIRYVSETESWGTAEPASLDFGGRVPRLVCSEDRVSVYFGDQFATRSVSESGWTYSELPAGIADGDTLASTGATILLHTPLRASRSFLYDIQSEEWREQESPRPLDAVALTDDAVVSHGPPSEDDGSDYWNVVTLEGGA
jgi:hypothetical protein